jgi:hypothetical protein
MTKLVTFTTSHHRDRHYFVVVILVACYVHVPVLIFVTKKSVLISDLDGSGDGMFGY